MATNNEKLKRYALSGTMWKFAERIIAQVVSMIVQIMLARILLPEDYSVVSVVTIFFAFCNVLITGGLNTALIQKKDADKEDYSTVFCVSMMMATVLYFGMFFSANWIANIYGKKLLVPIIRVMSLTFFTNVFVSVLSAYASNNLQFKNFFFSTLIGTAVSGFVGIAMAMKGFGAWALVGQQMIRALCNAVVLRFTTGLKIKVRMNFARLRRLLEYGFKIFLASIIGVLYEQINPLIIGVRFSSADLAYYTKGQGFPGLINSSISDTLSAVLFPVISKLQDSKEDVLNVTRRYIKVASYVVFPIMLGFFSIAEEFVSIVLTDKWLPAVPYIRIFCFTYMFNIIQTGNIQAIKAIGRSDIVLTLEVIKKSIYFTVVALFVFLSDSPVILALSSVICTLVATVVNTYPNKKLIGYRYRYQILDLFPNFVLAIIMGIFVNLLTLIDMAPFMLFVLQLLGGVGIYLLLSVVTKNENFYYLLGYIETFLNRK